MSLPGYTKEHMLSGLDSLGYFHFGSVCTFCEPDALKRTD